MALALLAAAGSGLFIPSPALASHTCLHYVVVACQSWEELGYSSQAECHEVESMQCSQRAIEPAGNLPLAASDRKLPRPASAAASTGPSAAGAPPAAVRSLELGAK